MASDNPGAVQISERSNMSFLRKMAETFRAVNEGRATAKAHRLAEEFLGEKLPIDVGADGYAMVAHMADFSSIEQMAMIYVTVYARRMTNYLDAVSATPDFRLRVARNVARACISLARLQRSGTRFAGFWTRDLIEAAKKHGVKTDSEQISFVV
jgi:hypothetical protein